MEHIRLKILESHDEILNIINRNIGTLVNFDYLADYSVHPNKILDADFYSEKILKSYKECICNNWVTILASKGYINRYIWMYPHGCGKDEIKIFKSKKGSCEVYNIKFNGKAKLPYKYITIDGSFFGCDMPFDWNPENRIELFNNVLRSITARNVMLVVSKSKNFVNYDVDNFLDDMKKEMTKWADIEELP